MSNPVPPEEKFHSTKQVAEMYAVQPETVVDWIKRGLLPGTVKIGTRWKIPRSSVLALAESKYGSKP